MTPPASRTSPSPSPTSTSRLLPWMLALLAHAATAQTDTTAADAAEPDTPTATLALAGPTLTTAAVASPAPAPGPVPVPVPVQLPLPAQAQAQAPAVTTAQAASPSTAPSPAPSPAPSTAPTAAAAPTPAHAPAAAPAAAPVPSTARAPAPGTPEPRFDLAVSNAPAAQVFLQLAQGSPYNMLVAPEVSGSLSVTLKDTTVPEAMDTLRELFGYEYRITGNRIFVYPNTVQTRLYRINYLPGRRQGSSDLRVSSGSIVPSSGGMGGLSGGSTQTNATNGGQQSRGNDNAEVRTTSDADFWREVQASLTTMVGTAGGRNVVLNPAAGVVVVKATPAELRQVENYLKAVQLSIERQVMLEAKIVEVQLSKDSQTGINWAGFGKVLGDRVNMTLGSMAPGSKVATEGNITGNDGSVVAPGISLAAGALGRGFYGLAFQAANFAGLLNFLQSQGEVQVLSSPRIATLNNQKAVLKVGSDELYVTGVSTSTNSNGTNTTSSPTVTLQPFFSGISLDVTPQIDDAGNVMLHVHPTISTVSEKNKNIDLGALGSYRLPLAASSVNETDSIVRVKDGQIVAIGGLMKAEVQEERSGMPGLQDAPFIGGLFRQNVKARNKRELVIMLKPTIIREDGAWPDSPMGAAPDALLGQRAEPPAVRPPSATGGTTRLADSGRETATPVTPAAPTPR